MKPFVINRYGRLVFPSNFFPELDFSIFESLDQFAAVIKRDFEDKSPTEADIAARLPSGAYKGRYDMRPTRWRDVPRQRDDVFLPIFKPWDGAELATTIEAGYRALPPTWSEGT